MPKNKKCQFKSEVNPDYACPEFPLEESNYCIFHKPDKTDAEAKLFKEKVTRKLQNKDYDFTGYYFPAGVNFENQVFEADAYFTESTFEAEIGFWKSIFKGDVSFEKSIFKHNAYFDKLTFKGDVIFDDSIFTGSVGSQDVIFKENANFASLTVKKAINLQRLSFKKNVTFAFSTFHSTVWFTELTFLGKVNFFGTTFRRIGDFKEIIFEDNASQEHFSRITKNYYQKEGNYSLAGEYYYKERIAKRKQLPWYSPKRWFEYILLDGLCGYGERPLRAIRTGLGVLFGLAFLYWRIGHIYPSPELFNEPHTLTFLDSLYFSVVTFTTLGFGDWRPDPFHWIRYIVMSEAFIGAFLMALFIVTFARRMMR